MKSPAPETNGSPEDAAALKEALHHGAWTSIAAQVSRLSALTLGKLLEEAVVDPCMSVEGLEALLHAPDQQGTVIAPAPRVNALIRAAHARRAAVVSVLASGLDEEEVAIAFRGLALSTRVMDAGSSFPAAASILAPLMPIEVLDVLPADVLARLPNVQALREARHRHANLDAALALPTSISTPSRL